MSPQDGLFGVCKRGKSRLEPQLKKKKEMEKKRKQENHEKWIEKNSNKKKRKKKKKQETKEKKQKKIKETKRFKNKTNNRKKSKTNNGSKNRNKTKRTENGDIIVSRGTSFATYVAVRLRVLRAFDTSDRRSWQIRSKSDHLVVAYEWTVPRNNPEARRAHRTWSTDPRLRRVWWVRSFDGASPFWFFCSSLGPSFVSPDMRQRNVSFSRFHHTEEIKRVSDRTDTRRKCSRSKDVIALSEDHHGLVMTPWNLQFRYQYERSADRNQYRCRSVSRELNAADMCLDNAIV